MDGDQLANQQTGTLTGPTQEPLSGTSAADAPGGKVFLAWTPDDIRSKRDQFARMLEKAGYEVFPQTERPEDEAEFRKQVRDLVEESDLSVHILGGAHGEALPSDPDTSLTKFQFDEASKKADKSEGKYKRLVWLYPLEGLILEAEQQALINEVQNNITPDMMVNAAGDGAQFIDDMRTFLEKAQRTPSVRKEYDVAFIFNVEDAGDCYETAEQLGKDVSVQTLTVVPEKAIDYRAEAENIIWKSRLVVVYFKEASDWAVSFVKQVWKQIGGVSAGIPFLLIGEDEPRRNRFIRFEAPQVYTRVLPREQIYETITATQQEVAEKGRLSQEVSCPYTGLRPFNENESIYFKGREKHVDQIIYSLDAQRFVMVTGSSGDGKSSLIYAGVIPSLKGGFLKTHFAKWAVADFRPERSPLRNLSESLAQQLRLRNPDEVENTLSYGFSALVDMYKESDLYCDITSQEYIEGDDETQRDMKRKASNLLILVDQFEEFFTNFENFRDGIASPTAQITVNVLIETIRIAREEQLPIYVIFTMRSDYIGQCVAFRGFAELIGHSTYFVPRLKREEIQEVIEAPAYLNGDSISMRLVQRVLNDLGEGIDQLPVLQHAMHQIWHDAQEDGREMDLIHYAKVGGLAPKKLPIEDRATFNEWFATLEEDMQELYDKPRLRNILNRHANELYLRAHQYYNEHSDDTISAEDARYVLRIAFTGLTRIDENRAVRNRISLEEITQILNQPDFDSVTIGRLINTFREPGNTFVQPFIQEGEAKDMPANTILDITHESLIRNWDHLIEWAEQEYKSVQVYEDFKVQVNRWLENDASPKYLLTVGTYNYFNDWYERQQPTPAWIRRYIRPEELEPEMEPMEQATRYLEDIEEFLALSRQRIERQRRIMFFIIGLISVLFLFSLIAAYLANEQRKAAEEQRLLAEQRTREAERARLIAEIQQNQARYQRVRAEKEKLRATQQALIAESERLRAEDAKREAELQAKIAELKRLEAEKAREEAEAQRQLAEKQKQLATLAKERAEEAKQRALLQAENAQRQRNNAYITQSLFLSSLAEEQVNAGKPELAIKLAAEGLPKQLDDPSRPYVAEGEAAMYYAANAIVNREPAVTMNGHTNRVVYTKFAPEGNSLITTSWDKTARIWNTETGELVSTLRGHRHIVDRGYFSPEGGLIVTLGEDFTARLWDFKRKREVTAYRGHADELLHASFSPDADKVVTTSEDNTARLWEAQSGRLVAEARSHTDDVVHSAFSPNGETFVTASKDHTARLWSAKDGSLLATLRGHKGAVNYAEFSPDNEYVLTVSDDHRAILWDVESGRKIHAFVGHKDEVLHAEFSHDGQRVVTTSADRTARVWNVESGMQLAVLRGHSDAVYHATFSPNDQRLATASEDGTVRLWDGFSYLRLTVYKDHPKAGFQPSFSPDGNYMAMANRNHQVELYEVLPAKQKLITMVLDSLKQSDLSPRERERFFLKDKRLQEELTEEEFKKRMQEMEDEADDAAAVNGQPNGLSAEPPKAGETLKQEQSKHAAPPKPDGDEASDADMRAAPSNEPQTHIVQEGETLWKISKRYEVPVGRLRKLNNLQGNDLTTGQRLKLR